MDDLHAKLEELRKALEERGVAAELDEDFLESGDGDYLLRFNFGLVLMHDLGITWEPAKAYPTPRYCRVSLDDIPATADKMARISKAWDDDKLPTGAEGEGAAEAI